MLSTLMLFFVAAAIGLPGTCHDVGRICEGCVGIDDTGDKEVTLVADDFSLMVTALAINSSQLMSPEDLDHPVCDNVWVGLNFFGGGFRGWLVTFGHWMGGAWLMSTGEPGLGGPGGRVQRCCTWGQESSGIIFVQNFRVLVVFNVFCVSGSSDCDDRETGLGGEDSGPGGSSVSFRDHHEELGAGTALFFAKFD